jgi:hypothetical protein
MSKPSYYGDVRTALSPRALLAFVCLLAALATGAILSVGYGAHPRWLAAPAFALPLSLSIMFRRWVQEQARRIRAMATNAPGS